MNDERCWTCGRPRGLDQPRGSWGIHPTVFIPRTENPGDSPAQSANDLICSVGVYRNGGTDGSTHLCNECLRIALREIKVRVSEALGGLDADHDKDAEMAKLTERLAHLQCRHHNVCFDHDRMQERMRALLVSSVVPDPEVAHAAEFEVGRGGYLKADAALCVPEHKHRWGKISIPSTEWRPGHAFVGCLEGECFCELWDDGVITNNGEPLK